MTFLSCLKIVIYHLGLSHHPLRLPTMTIQNASTPMLPPPFYNVPFQWWRDSSSYSAYISHALPPCPIISFCKCLTYKSCSHHPPLTTNLIITHTTAYGTSYTFILKASKIYLGCLLLLFLPHVEGRLESLPRHTIWTVLFCSHKVAKKNTQNTTTTNICFEITVRSIQ